jgi:hypothetical protein
MTLPMPLSCAADIDAARVTVRISAIKFPQKPISLGPIF